MKIIKLGSHPQNDIVLSSDKVSGFHAELFLLNNGDILLEDKNSLNGTFVANQRIQPGREVTVKRGDNIRLADMELPWGQVPQHDDNSRYKKILGIGSNFRNEIQVAGKTVSRFHATLKVDKRGQAFIEDHSLNGTTVNSKRIVAHQDVRLAPNDNVVVGGVPVNLQPYIKANVVGMVLKGIACLAAVALLVFAITKLVGTVGGSKNPPVQALAQATPIVYGAYYIDVTLKDDPFVGLIADWPEKWQFGLDDRNELVMAASSRSMVSPIEFSGTAFFISPYGEMGTNRHIAVPWEYLSKAEVSDIRQQMQEYVGALGKGQAAVSQILQSAINRGQLSVETAIAYIERFTKSDFEISGHFEYFGIVLPGHNISTLSDLMSCQVIAESGDPKKDVALLRLNSQQTPEFIVRDGYYRIENARMDETQLDLSKEQLKVIGYPGGVSVGFKSGTELNPTIHNATISKIPDDNEFQIQSVGLSGQSGSPVIDAKGNLVGVFYGGIGGNEISYCCNIKHLAELYNHNKVRR